MQDPKSIILRKQKKNQGFTLVEAMITAALFSIIFAALFRILLAGTQSWEVGDVRIQSQQEMRKSLEWIKEDLRQAGRTSIIDVPADGVWRSSISFRKSAGVSGGSIVWETNPVQYQLGGSGTNQLQRIQGTQTHIIAQNVQALQFRRQATAADIVEVSFQTNLTSLRGHPVGDALSFEIFLRN